MAFLVCDQVVGDYWENPANVEASAASPRVWMARPSSRSCPDGSPPAASVLEPFDLLTLEPYGELEEGDSLLLVMRAPVS